MKIKANSLITILFENEQGNTYIRKDKLKDIVNDIIKIASSNIQYNEKYINMTTKYIIIGNKKYSLKSDITMKFEIAYLSINVPIVCKGYFDKKYNVEIETEIKNFYNDIVKIAEEYAYELDTDINNIQISVKELKILNNYKLEEGE